MSGALPNVRRVIDHAARLRRRQAVLSEVLLTGAFAAGAMLLVILAARLVPALGLPPGHAAWRWIALAAGAVVLGAALRRFLGRSDALGDAIAVDERLGLRDRLSTSLALVREDAPFAQAAVRDGETLAAERTLPERVKRAFAVQWPQWWWVAPVLALAAFMSAWFLPQFDPWSRDDQATPEEVRQVQDAVSREIDTVTKAIESNPDLANAMEAELDAMSEPKVDDPVSPEELRREGLRKITEIQERLEQLLEGEEAQTLEALKDQLSGMQLPKSPEAMKLAEALKRGDFAKAKEALEALQKDLAEGKLSEEQKEALSKAIEKMAEELAQSESERKAVEEALKQAGLDPQLASNPEALKQALENSQRLNDSQRQALQKAAQCQQSAAQMRKQLAQQMSQMASQCKGGQQGQNGQCGQGVGEMLSALEMQQAMMMQAKAAASACKGGKAGLCSGGAPGSNPGGGFSNGMTNSGGIGGGWRPEMPTATKTKVEQAKGDGSDADVIAREFIEGTPTVGTSNAVLKRVEAMATSAADEGTDDEPTPPDRVEVQKHYFGQVKKQIEARRAAAGGAGSSAAPASGTPAPAAPAPGAPSAPTSKPTSP